MNNIHVADVSMLDAEIISYYCVLRRKLFKSLSFHCFLIDWQLKRCWMMIFWRDIRPYFKIKLLFCTDPFSGHFLRGV